MQATEVLQIVVLSSAVALVTEAVMWLWAFRRDSFRTLRVGHFLLPQDWPGPACPAQLTPSVAQDSSLLCCTACVCRRA